MEFFKNPLKIPVSISVPVCLESRYESIPTFSTDSHRKACFAGWNSVETYYYYGWIRLHYSAFIKYFTNFVKWHF